MDFNFSPLRLLLLAALIALFALLAGFTPPKIPSDSLVDASRLAKAWRTGMFMYLAGAFLASCVDHVVGNLDRSNVRSLYMILGFLLMAGSVFWLRSLRGAMSEESAQAARVHLAENPARMNLAVRTDRWAAGTCVLGYLGFVRRRIADANAASPRLGHLNGTGS